MGGSGWIYVESRFSDSVFFARGLALREETPGGSDARLPMLGARAAPVVDARTEQGSAARGLRFSGPPHGISIS